MEEHNIPNSNTKCGCWEWFYKKFTPERQITERTISVENPATGPTDYNASTNQSFEIEMPDTQEFEETRSTMLTFIDQDSNQPLHTNENNLQEQNALYGSSKNVNLPSRPLSANVIFQIY
jgi:hypothetical protein